MVTKTKKGAQLTFNRTRPKFGKIFVVIVLMDCGHSSIAGMLSYAAGMLSYAARTLTQHRGIFVKRVIKYW